MPGLVALALYLVVAQMDVPDLTGVAGQWWRHGILVTISRNGVGVADWRDGGAVFMFERREGDILSGHVVATDDPTALRRGPFRIRLVGSDGLDIEQSDTATLSLCARRAIDPSAIPAEPSTQTERCGA